MNGLRPFFLVRYHDLFVLVADQQLASTDLNAPCQALFEVANGWLQHGCWCDPTIQFVHDVIRFKNINIEELGTNAHTLLKKQLPCMKVKVSIKQRPEQLLVVSTLQNIIY